MCLRFRFGGAIVQGFCEKSNVCPFSGISDASGALEIVFENNYAGSSCESRACLLVNKLEHRWFLIQIHSTVDGDCSDSA